MAKRSITTSIELTGEQEFKNQLGDVNRLIKLSGSNMALLEEQFKGQANSVEFLTKKSQELSETQKLMSDRVQLLRQAVVESTEAFGDADPRTVSYQKELNYALIAQEKLNREMKDTKRYMNEAQNSVDKVADSIDELGKEVKKSSQEVGEMGGAFGDVFGKIDGLIKGFGVGAAINGAKELGSAIIGIVESTEEYRTTMGKLEASSRSAGYSAEQTSEIFDEFHSVLGDEQVAATATANLQAIGIEQERLMDLANLAIGAWVKYGDSIPIDTLTEAINETVRTGEVTGAFADVINWAGQSEEFFTDSMKNMELPIERVNFLLEMMGRQGLAETAEAWKENNQDIIAMNAATGKLEASMARLGEKLVPVAANVKSFAADAVNAVADMITAIRDTASLRLDTMMGNYTPAIDGSHASGLDYVPYDGYVAELHAGEAVLTAAQASTLRALSADLGSARMPAAAMAEQPGQAAGAGYSPAAANDRPMEFRFSVDLDGQTVARKTYRYIQREGELRGGSLVEVTG